MPVFSKLAAQLSTEKLQELWIIPAILFIQTIVSWVSAWVLCRVFGLRKKPQSNFVTAMAVNISITCSFRQYTDAALGFW